MKDTVLYTNKVTNEENMTFHLEYSLLVSVAEEQEIYGIAVGKTDAGGMVEIDAVEGFSDNCSEAERFLARLAEGRAFPVELSVLCDDYIAERESENKRTWVQAAS